MMGSKDHGKFWSLKYYKSFHYLCSHALEHEFSLWHKESVCPDLCPMFLISRCEWEGNFFFTKYVSSFYFKYAPLIIVWVSSKDRIITYVDIWLVCGLANHQVKGIREGGVGGYKSIIFARILDSLWSHNIFVTSHSKYGFFNAFFFMCGSWDPGR